MFLDKFKKWEKDNNTKFYSRVVIPGVVLLFMIVGATLIYHLQVYIVAKKQQQTYLLKVLSAGSRDISGTMSVEGRVENISAKSLDNVQAIVSWYNENEDLITIDTAVIEKNPLLKGQISSFKVISQYTPSMMKFSIQFRFVSVDTIFLENGQSLEGVVVSQDKDQIHIKQYSGSGEMTVVYPRSAVIDVVGEKKGNYERFIPHDKDQEDYEIEKVKEYSSRRGNKAYTNGYKKKNVVSPGEIGICLFKAFLIVAIFTPAITETIVWCKTVLRISSRTSAASCGLTAIITTSALLTVLTSFSTEPPVFCANIEDFSLSISNTRRETSPKSIIDSIPRAIADPILPHPTIPNVQSAILYPSPDNS